MIKGTNSHSDEYKFILMRHGYSKHNEIKKNRQNESASDKSIKILDLNILTDCSLVNQGINQSIHCAQIIDPEDISLILVSPLRRCLETCKIMTQQWERVPNIIVEPSLTHRKASMAFTLNNAVQLSKLFNTFDFRLVYSQLKQQKKNKTGEESKVQENMLMRQDNYLSYKHLRKRLVKFRQKLKQLAVKTTKKIMIISHNSLLRCLIDSDKTSDNKPTHLIKFSTCNPIYLRGKKSMPHKLIVQGGQSRSIVLFGIESFYF